ncbi:MAG: nucleotidyltransferase domain-containing protein [archaeon]|nr:nucleotidyltransferase domain-containing protein [archaeon]
MKTNSSESIIWESNIALKLLISFFTTGRQYYEKEIHEKTGISQGAVNKYLKLLADENYLLLKKHGKMNFLKLNRDNPVVKHLKISYSLSQPLMHHLQAIAKQLGLKLYLYGSAARGEDDENSDWDILIIGDAKTSELEAKLYPIRKESEKEIKLTIFTKREWLNLHKKDPAFFERLEKDRIELLT